MFIGCKRSCHNLVAAMLDAHPEIVISPGYRVIEKWEQYQSPELKEKSMQKYRLFYDLHHHSLEHAMFIKRASSESCLRQESQYNYHIPGLWQGGFQHRIKVNYRIATNIQLLFHALRPSKKKHFSRPDLYKKRRAGGRVFFCYLLFPIAYFLYTLLPSPGIRWSC